MKTSKLVHNLNNYTSISANAQCGVLVDNANRNNYYIGFEEWNNSEILKRKKLAYLDSYRSCVRPNEIDKILLFSFNTQNSHIYLIGYLYGVKQIKNDEIQGIRNDLLNANWLRQVEQDFHNIEDFRYIENHNQYYNCWTSEAVVANPATNFILNVRYEKLEIFEPQNRINLTAVFPEINSKWKRLRQLHNASEEILAQIDIL